MTPRPFRPRPLTAGALHACAAALVSALGAAVLLTGAAPAADAPEESADAPELYTRGWLELARVQPVDLLIRAKLDSGAKTTAIHADILRGPVGVDMDFPDALDDDVEIDDSDVSDEAAGDDAGPEHRIADDEVEDDGPNSQNWGDTIVFALESRAGRRVVFEREVVRWVHIKKRDGGLSTRPVVNMEFCIGGVRLSGEVGLTDRGDFNYPLLVGRTMLADGNVLIDPRKTFTHRSRCYPDGPRAND